MLGAALELGSTAWAPIPQVAAGAPSVQVIDARDGLSHNSTFTILQDHEGFVWLGTIDGLNRFDGTTFRVFRHDPSDPGSLSNSTVRRVVEDGARNLWVRTEAGLDRLDRRTFRFHRYAVAAQQLALDRRGRLLVASTEQLLRYDPETDRFETLASFPLEPSGRSPSDDNLVWGIVEAAAGDIWLSTERGDLLGIAPAGRVTHAAAPWAEVILGFEDEAGGIWLGHERGVAVYDPTSGLFTRPPRTEAVGGPVLSLLRDDDGTIWVGGDRLYRIPADGAPEVVPFGADPREPLSTPIWAIAQDREEALWIGTPRGAKLLNPYAKSFRTYGHDPSDPASLSGDPVVSLAGDDRGHVWVGTLGFGLNRLDPSSGLAVRYPPRPEKPGGLCGERVWALAPGPDGRVWAGTERGLCVLDARGDRFARIPLAAGGDGQAPIVFVLAFDHRGQLWAGTSAGLFRVDPGTAAASKLPRVGLDRTGRVGVEGLALGADGGLWVATTRSDLYRVDVVSLEAAYYPLGDSEALRGSEGFWSIAERPDGRLWMGSDRGLFVFDPERGSLHTLGLAQGLPPAAVYAIAEDGGGALWWSTNDGLLRHTSPLEMDARLDALRHYGVGDGLPDTEFNRRAATRLADGRLAFGGMGGVTILEPAALRDNPHPPAVALTLIRRLRREGAVELDPYGLETLQLPHDDTGLVIEFAALTYTNPVRATYAFRLEGYDPEWVRGGSQRAARYPALPPGRYRFRVRAANADGVWNHSGATIALYVPPPWWATAWFRILAGGTIAGAGALGVRQLATRRLRRRVRALELDRRIRLERERISRDLHDSVGSQVSTMLAGIELAQLTAGAGEHGHVEEHLAALRREAQRTMTQLHETVWSLHEERVSIASLADRVDAHLRERQRLVRRPELRSSAAGDLEEQVPAAHALHLFRIVQEAVSNALRHAGADSVTVHVRARAGEAVHLEILDDGVFRPAPPGHLGLGLAGMRARAEELGGTLVLEPAGSGGTAVRVVLPLRPAGEEL